MDAYITSVITQAVLAIAGIAVVFIFRKVSGYAKEYYQANTTLEQQKIIKQVITDAVAYAEKQGWDRIGKEKFEMAKTRAEGILAEKGIPVTWEDLQTSIEAACLELDKAQGKLDKGAK
ncbi:MAG: phage holin, LLH family [Aerococcus sanguinicola]|uniref:phage holin, LLH family n=1 Tax=Aerococcus sp. HMSC062A02 TaxID=1715105 RepID=UPI0008A11162|nr:phage holin, LLH family [Aerococcus sp. HMSC062A02]OFN02652.1 hypothetical protein HMPREF2626_01700 [Aerococcus sp. HMSC062A02]